MCNENVEGDKCDKCKTGYGVFPACDQCIDGYHGYPNCIGKFVSKSLFHIADFCSSYRSLFFLYRWPRGLFKYQYSLWVFCKEEKVKKVPKSWKPVLKINDLSIEMKDKSLI